MSRIAVLTEIGSRIGTPAEQPFDRTLVWQYTRDHYRAVLEAFGAADERIQLEDLALALGLPPRQIGNLAAVAWRWYTGARYPDPPDLLSLRDIWGRAAVAYDSDRVQPIRLGGIEVCGLDDLPEIVGNVMDATHLRPDFATVLLGLGFDFESARFLTLHKAEKLPAPEAGAVLGWDQQKTRAVQQKCYRTARQLRLAGARIPSARVKIGRSEWPGGAFERVAGGRLLFRGPR